jgi:uridine kinase
LNYDHPDSLETDLMVRHVAELKAGRSIEAPLYDFARYARRGATETVEPRRAIIVEGILVFTDQALRAQMDIKVFVDTDDDTRFIRRLQRDVAERGRTMDSVIDQYLGTVKPMHLEFVQPSKRYADVIIPQGGHNPVAVDLLLTLIRSLV